MLDWNQPVIFTDDDGIEYEFANIHEFLQYLKINGPKEDYEFYLWLYCTWDDYEGRI